MHDAAHITVSVPMTVAVAVVVARVRLVFDEGLQAEVFFD